MFNSIILDVLIGLVCSFLGVSLITSAMVEAINSLLQTRSHSLLSGIKSLVNDPQFTGLAKELYDHAAVNPRSSGAPAAADVSSYVKWFKVRLIPAYVDRTQFANALLDITGLSAANAAAPQPPVQPPVQPPGQPPGQPQPQPGRQALLDLKATVATNLKALGQTNPQIEKWLTGVLDRTQGDIDQTREEIATWFDNAMDRVGGAFKRQTQLISFVIAFAIAVMFHIDTIQLANRLWQQPMLVEQLKTCCDLQKPLDTPAATDAAAKQLEAIRAILPTAFPTTLAGRVETLVGSLATAFATLFGAPFWFDMLQTFVRLKGAGPSPTEKRDGSAASG